MILPKTMAPGLTSAIRFAFAMALPLTPIVAQAADAPFDCAALIERADRTVRAEYHGEGKLLNILPDGSRNSLGYKVGRVRISEAPERYVTTFTFLTREDQTLLRFAVRANADGSSPTVAVLDSGGSPAVGEQLVNDPRAPVLATALALEDFTLDFTAQASECAGQTERVAGRECAVVVSRAQGPTAGQERLERWLDLETASLVRLRRYGADGQLRKEIEFSGFTRREGRLLPSSISTHDPARNVRTILSLKSGEIRAAKPLTEER